MSTLADVAQVAGVSAGTVSRVLSGKGHISAATRTRVAAVARELGFTPNAIAKGLIRGRTGTVGVITGDLVGRFVLPVVRGVENILGVGEVGIYLADARDDPERESRLVRAMLQRRVDAIIVVGDTTDPRPSLGELPVPAVYAYSPSEDPRDRSVVADDVAGGRLATSHLLSIGRTRLAMITGDSTFVAAHDRATGFVKVLQQASLLPQGPPAFGAWSEQWGRDAIGQTLDRYPDTDGVVCGSDQIARGVLEELRTLRRPVPADIAVIGYDNWEALAIDTRPELTTVEGNLERLGELAARTVTSFDKLPDLPKTVAPSLVIRASTVPRLI